MNSLSVLVKYLDQPRLVGKFSKAVPAILVLGGAAVTYQHVKETPQKDKRKEFVKSLIVLGATITSALLAPKIALKITKSFSKSHAHTHNPHIHSSQLTTHCSHEHHHEHEHGEVINLKELKEEMTDLVDDFLSENKASAKTTQLLQKSKEKILNPSEIKTVFEELSENKYGKEGKEFLNKLVPNPENIDSKHIFGEIGRISILGLIPVLGGITGGMIADKATENNWKDRIPNKIKEGAYQYLANIFLCNIGAGAALLAMEKAKITSKAARATGMIAGIIVAGIVFGSAIANSIGKHIIDPIIKHRYRNNANFQGHMEIYSERKPEILDISLHVDDMATVAVMSGLKWIEPALPILYSISGYRAGIGYRNGWKVEEEKKAKFERILA